MTRPPRKPDMKGLAPLDAELKEDERKTALVIGASYDVRLDGDWKISPTREVLGHLLLRPGDRVRLTLTPDGVLMSSEEFIRQRIYKETLAIPTGLWNKCMGLFEGDRELAWCWLTSPSLALGGKRPVDIAKTDGGVEDLIGRLEHGVFS